MRVQTDRARLFDTNPAAYDKYRPTYPADVFEAIVIYARLPPGAIALDIGVGTGQASRPLLNAGVMVTGIEPGPRLATFAAKTLGEGFRPEIMPFEEFETDDRFDLIMSATAFHWINPDVGYRKALELLRPGGTIALFWNHPFPLEPIQSALQPAYERHRSGTTAERPREFRLADAEEIDVRLRESGFSDVVPSCYLGTRRLSADEYIGLHTTYSDHMSMPTDARLALQADMREIINAHGGFVDIRDTVDLHLGRRA